MLGLGRYAAYIPHAVLAGILIKVGIDIIDWHYLKKIRDAPRAGVTFMLVVLFLTVFVDLITAVSVGVIMASLLFVKRMADLQSESIRPIFHSTEDSPLGHEEEQLLAESDGRIALINIGGPLSFGAANELGRRLLVGGETKVLVLDFSQVPFIDSSASLAIGGVIERANDLHQHVLLVGVRESVAKNFSRLSVLQSLHGEVNFHTRLDALRHAASLSLVPAKAVY